ncbi:tetratricopeptide repeat domain-containing protein [Polychaeton citri CBS 116435]|uniref:ER membrane protein complex subunit 2 n=1 Tax=Polychaeton citri CBS 116435 TaxID=1314669 RepID=A0A9P4USX9_9PEZI|nr:tetratricopeptide repeat domain-containing protein [Polychaeton citri CBS 116435]
MSNSLLIPPTSTNPTQTLSLSQRATPWISSQQTLLSKLPYPLNLLITSESQEKWQSHENLYLSSLISGDNETAFQLLAALKDRFGPVNERVLALDGLYREASASSDAELETVLKRYDDLLEEDGTLFAIHKRKVALLKSMGKTSEAAKALVELIDSSPTDAEAWAELADLYITQGSFEQAVFCLEEVLTVVPNAWNMHARLGEVLFLQAQQKGENTGELAKALSEGVRRFCRSVELCDDYLRGYYGLKLSTTRLIELMHKPGSGKQSKASSDANATGGDLPVPPIEAIQTLNELATSKLTDIIRRGVAGESGWDGYSPAELIAARELLDRDTQKLER